MTEPYVCAICLTADRPEMTRQAIESFRTQTYANKRLLVYDTGAKPLHDLDIGDSAWPEWYAQRGPGRATVGELRNLAATFPMAANADIIIHLDSDDFSHPERFSEQVSLLRGSTGADCVGYNEMLFWREPRRSKTVAEMYEAGERPAPGTVFRDIGLVMAGEAWLYTNNDRAGYAIGTSLCYWRTTWERKPFEATSRGEDNAFLKGLNLACVSSVVGWTSGDDPFGQNMPPLIVPRMVARIHGGNTSENYAPSILEQSTNWKRVPEWDSYCAGVFA